MMYGIIINIIMIIEHIIVAIFLDTIKSTYYDHTSSPSFGFQNYAKVFTAITKSLDLSQSCTIIILLKEIGSSGTITLKVIG